MAETPRLSAYLPRILAYPLTGYGAGVVVFLAVLLWLGTASILGIALLAIAAPWSFHYFEGVIDQTALGRATPPAFGGDMLYLGSVRAFRPLIGALPVAAAYVLVHEQGPGAQVAVLAFGALLYPAFLLVLAVEGNVLTALNPLRALRTIAVVGPAYLGACAVLVGAVAVAVYAGSFARFISLLAAIYLAVMVFHMLGYVAFHNHDKLGLLLKKAPPTDESRRQEQQDARLKAVLGKIDAALHVRDLDAAAAALYAEPGGPASLRTFHEELFEQLQVSTRKNAALLHAQGARLVQVLLAEKRAARALDVAETCYDAHLDFQFEKPAHAVELASTALQARRLGLFDRIVRDAAQRYGTDPAAVSLQFLAAKRAYEVDRDESLARALLKPLAAHATHPWARQIAAYSRALGA